MSKCKHAGTVMYPWRLICVTSLLSAVTVVQQASVAAHFVTQSHTAVWKWASWGASVTPAGPHSIQTIWTNSADLSPRLSLPGFLFFPFSSTSGYSEYQRLWPLRLQWLKTAPTSAHVAAPRFDLCPSRYTFMTVFRFPLEMNDLPEPWLKSVSDVWFRSLVNYSRSRAHCVA